MTVINLSGGFANLTDSERALLSRATVKDVLSVSYSFYQYNGASNDTYDLRNADFSNTSLWTKLTPDFVTGGNSGPVSVQTGQTVLVKSSSGDKLYKYIGQSGSLNLNGQTYTDASRWSDLTSASAADGVVSLLHGGVVQNTDSVTLQLFDDVQVEASGSLSVDAGTGAAIQSNGAIQIDHVRSGGNVRLVSGASITDLNVAGSTSAIATFGDLILQARMISSAAQPRRPLCGSNSPPPAISTPM